MTIKDGQRASTSTDYLKPVLQRSNLHINSRVLVEKILIEGNKAVAVQFQRKGQQHYQVIQSKFSNHPLKKRFLNQK